MINGCPFCNHQDSHIFRKNQRTKSGESRDIVICNECGLLYPDSRMDINEIQEYLRSTDTNQTGFSFGDPLGCAAQELKNWKFIQHWVRPEDANALDIGTFDGSFCRILEMLGFRAFGLEPQLEAVNHARKYGINVYAGSFPDAIPDELNRNKYALISLMECIYYLADLRLSLQSINQMLIDNGCLLIKCHQGYSRYYEKNSFFSRYGDYVQGIPSLASLHHCLGKTGFKIVKILGECSPDLLPFPLSLPSVPFLRSTVARFYQLLMLNWTLMGIQKADRLIILAQKTHL